MLPLISVIVPVYNTERYLDKCVSSILNQTYQNLEIILIDDGSDDSSPQKCDEYARIDPRIKVIHKKNGGQSCARNAGLDICSGDYISFIDSDDWIEPEMYSLMLEQIEKHSASLVICGRYDSNEKTGKKTIGKRLEMDGVFFPYSVFPQMVLGKLSDFSVCDKLHSRKIWENIRFPEGQIYEDFAVMYKIILSAESIVLLDVPLYTYNHRENSTVTSDFKLSQIDYIKQTKTFLEDITLRYPEYTQYAIWAHIKAIQVVLIKLLRSKREIFTKNKHLYEKYIQDIKKYRQVWRKNELFSYTDKIICEILLNKRIAYIVFRVKHSSC